MVCGTTCRVVPLPGHGGRHREQIQVGHVYDVNVQRKSVGSHASRGGGECEGEVADWSDDEPESKQSRVQTKTKGGGGIT